MRERQWLAELPHTVAGQRIYVDAFCRDAGESTATWDAAVAAATHFQNLGGHPILSRSVDTMPPDELRARRANNLDVQLVLAFMVPQDGEEAVYFFASEHSRSAAGERLATEVAMATGLPVRGVTIPMVTLTRSPAVVVATLRPDAALGRTAAQAIAELHTADQLRN